MPKNSQQDRRSYVQAKDEHGRLWGVTVEATRGKMLPVGPFEPLGWTAPWYPPSQYMDLSFESFQPQVKIDYVRLIADRRVALREYQQRARRVGQKLHGQAFRADQPPTHQMIEEIGEPPHAWQLADAARRGDRWVLGLTDQINPKVAKYLPEPDRDEDGFSDDDLDLGDEETAPRTQGRRRGAGQPADAGV